MASSSGWTAGVVNLGPPPKQRHDEPQHVVRMTVTTEHPDHYVTAQEAIESRVQRLRNIDAPFTREGMTLRYSAHGQDVQLEYLEPGA